MGSRFRVSVAVAHVPSMDDFGYAICTTNYGDELAIILEPVGDKNTLNLTKYFNEKNV